MTKCEATEALNFNTKPLIES